MNWADLWTPTVAVSPLAGALAAWGTARSRTPAAWLRTRLQPRSRSLRGLSAPVTSPRGLANNALVALEGALVSARVLPGALQALAVSAHGADGSSHHGAVEGLRIALDGGAVEVAVEGPVCVTRAPREAPPWAALGPLETPVVAWLAVLASRPQREVARSTRVARVLVPGDRVVAVGRLRVRPVADASAAYREARVEYALTPGDGGAVVLVGEAPETWPRTATRVALAALAAPALTAALWALFATAAMAVAAPSVRVAHEGAREYREFAGRAWAAEAALVSPLHRAEARRALAWSQRYRRRHTAASMRLAVEHSLAAGECLEAVDAAMERGRWREAGALAARPECATFEGFRHPERRALAAYASGDFAEASELLDAERNGHAAGAASGADPFDLRVHLLAGNDALAARAARRRAGRLRARGLDGLRRASDPASADVLECVADALAARGGDRGALARLRAYQGHDRTACGLLLADVTPPGDRSDLLWVREDVTSTALGARLAWESGRARRGVLPCSEDWGALLVAPEAAMRRRAPGLDHALVRGLTGDDPDDALRSQVDLRCSVAAFEALAGDDAAARSWAEEAYGRLRESMRRGAAPWHRDAYRGVARLRVAVELLAGDAAAARRLRDLSDETGDRARLLDALLGLGEGAPDVAALAELAGDTRGERDGWRRLAAADPAATVAALHGRGWERVPAWVMFGGRSLDGVRAEVRAWLDWDAPPACVACPATERLVALRRHAVAARAALASVDAAAAEPLARALRMRRNAVVLAVVEGRWRDGWW